MPDDLKFRLEGNMSLDLSDLPEGQRASFSGEVVFLARVKHVFRDSKLVELIVDGDAVIHVQERKGARQYSRSMTRPLV